MIATQDDVTFWIDVISAEFWLPEQVREYMRKLASLGLLEFFVISPGPDAIFPTGLFAYLITDDLRGGKCMAEVMFYILPEYRGDLRLVKKYITTAEQVAREKSCKSIRIGANIGYNDASLLRLLKRWGYGDDTVSKYL